MASGWDEGPAYGNRKARQRDAPAADDSYAHLARAPRRRPRTDESSTLGVADGYPRGGHPGTEYADDEYADAEYADDHYPDDGGHVDEHGRWVYDDDAEPAAGRGEPGVRTRAGQRPAARAGHARRRPPRRGHPVRTAVLALLVALVIVAGGLFVHFEGEINPGGHPGKVVSLTIQPGDSSAQIGATLAKAGVIHGSSLFRYYAKLKGAGPLLPGTYHLAANEKYDQVISALSAGPPQVVERLLIPEGFTMQQVAARVAALPKLGFSASKFLAAASSGQVRSPYEPSGVNDLEGLVFPATYEVRQGMTETDVLQALVDRFDQEASSLNLAQAATTLGMSPYQVVTVASIVEREAKLGADRGPVASTIYNRLKAGIPLGADSTLVYALRQSNPSLSVSAIDYNQPNPYNTRLNKGLPPTPIANPGVPSLTAATAPPATKYLYFVETNPDGKLGFASTSAGFASLEAQCRKAGLC